MSEIITGEKLNRLVDEWIAAGGLAVGPICVKDDLVQYMPLKNAAALLLEGFIHPANALKEFLFPRHECLYEYKLKGKEVEIVDNPPAIPKTLAIGARPCDAAALSILDDVFNWDYKDDFYNRRREATTVVTLACKSFDESCFCTSVGLGPAAERGSDAMILDLGGGQYEVRTFTDKGRAVFQGRTEKSAKTAPEPEGPGKRFEVEDVQAFLKDHFEDPIWKERSLRCLGCGACAYTCPTCHCFDIVDERKPGGGCRARNWDACQFNQFTQHASGHNPRTSQPQRQRQRITHKFSIYPGKFGKVLCTGCGNCVRNCPVHLGVLSILEAAAEAAVAGAEKG
jgi:ferredoxin